uniref:Uncharacterized protein n=1 Tax=Rhizophora mucronata TaxID=61149 RepID=A0A2P2P619_RHIMU
MDLHMRDPTCQIMKGFVPGKASNGNRHWKFSYDPSICMQEDELGLSRN